MKILLLGLAVIFFLLTLPAAFSQDAPPPICGQNDTRPCGSNIGICVSGLRHCVDGQWSQECEGAVEPRDVDICGNELDDNCDGQVDEGCMGTVWTIFIIVGVFLLVLALVLYYAGFGKGEKQEIIGDSLGKDIMGNGSEFL